MDDDRGGDRRPGRRGGIAVGGSGSVLVEPDIASLSVSVRWQDRSLASARSAVATKASAARDHLFEAGVSPADLQTSQLTVHTIRHRHDRPGPVEFAVGTTLTATFRGDLTRAQAAVDGLFDIVGEGLELHGLEFDCGDRTAARTEARRLAFADARSKAAQLADLAGASLGAVRSIREGAPGHRPGPPIAGRAMLAAEASMPIEGGSLVEQVDLEVRWSLAAPPEL